MDRLIIESILSDTNEIFLSKDITNELHTPGIILGFKATNIDQIIHAFTALKKIIGDKKVEIIICKTLQAGIYDLEICTDALDEPVRITNKVINQKVINEIEGLIHKKSSMVLTTNVSEEENQVKIHTVQIKHC